MGSAVLDASAVLALLKKEPGADAVRARLGGSLISAVNLSEVISKHLDWGASLDEVMRALAPAATGTVRRGPVEVAWERFGEGGPAVLFVGVDPIVESRMWKGQVPWLARRHTVLTFDPPGNGRSSRTTDPRAYGDDEFIAAALGVLDANEIERAVVAGVCQGAGIALVLAADHPDRVDGVVAINPGLVLSPPHLHRRRSPGRTFDARMSLGEVSARPVPVGPSGGRATPPRRRCPRPTPDRARRTRVVPRFAANSSTDAASRGFRKFVRRPNCRRRR